VDRLPYIGCDCCPGAGLEWVRTGLLTASIINPPTGGLALDMMVQAIKTQLPPPECTTVDPVSYPVMENLEKIAVNTSVA
jgi:hypothetical protein